ncbi:hypothetical protein Areg01_40110 [Actinoplanes regularis]|nr:hypothetical protein Areg01_40110 [Actinoplanes regularis]
MGAFVLATEGSRVMRKWLLVAVAVVLTAVAGVAAVGAMVTPTQVYACGSLDCDG